MIFDRDDAEFSLLDVITFRQHDTVCRTPERPFGCISLRISGNSDVKWKNGTVHLDNMCISYFPPMLSYERKCVYDDMIVFHLNVRNYVSQSIETFTVTDRDGFLNLFSEGLEKWKEKKDGYRYDTLSVLYRIMAKARGERRAQIISETLTPAIDFIHKNYTNPELSVSEIASYAHISETYLRRKFIEETGISPKKYIINLRLQNARSLLNAGYNTVSEIAELCGFNDPKHFATIYRKYTGSVPSKQHYTFKDEGGTVYFSHDKN